jgi:hypothetical protein
MLLGPDGARLAKRAPGMTLRDQRAAGRSGADLARAIARAYGHALPEGEDPVAALAARLSWERLRGLQGVVTWSVAP